MKTLKLDNPPPATAEILQAENEELRRRLEEAEETIAAIRSGAVDAVVVEEAAGHRVYTLEGADRPYRLFVEEMQQGAATLHADGTIVWCNRQLTNLLQMPQEKLLGAKLHDLVAPEIRASHDNLFWQDQTRSGRGEAQLCRSDGGLVPVFLTFSALPKGCGAATGVLVTDLTTQRHHEELTATHAALQQSEARLATELTAARQLQEISSRLIQEDDVGRLYHEILDAVMAIMKSDMASMQKVDEEQDALRLLAWRGFDSAFANSFELVRPETMTACSAARRIGQRVIVPDVETCDFIAGTPALEDHRKTGIRAVQSTPLYSRAGRMLGMISTHWRKPHQPTERDLRLMDVLARQAADLLERKLAEQSLRESERRFREMIDALPTAIYTTDAKGRLTHFNPATVEFSGRTPKLGTDHWCVSFKLYHPDGRPMPHDECPMAIALKEGRVIRGSEAIAERPDGRRVWFTPYPTPLRDVNGKIVGGINMLVDITERKEAEEQLRRNHDTFFSLVEKAPFGVYVVDAQFRLRQVSAGSQKVFRTVRPLLGCDFAEALRIIWPEPFASDAIAHFRHTLKTGEPYIATSTTEKRRDIAEIESYDWRIERVTLPDGQFGVVCYFYDITERKEAENALQAAQAQLEEHARKLESRVAERTADLQATNEQLETFVYSVAHDLRGPLRSLAGYSQILVDDYAAELNETPQMLLKRIHASSSFMDKLLLDLLAFGGTARSQVELGPVQVRKAWDIALFQTSNQIEQTQASIEAIGTLPVVRAHEAMLGQCLGNLVSNAIKFVAPGIRPHIRLRAEEIAPSPAGHEGGKKVRLWLEDNGIGIAPEDHERAFRVFERLNGARYSGTGIGLSIVRKGVERMGGRVGLESEPGKGTRFWIELTKGD